MTTIRNLSFHYGKKPELFSGLSLDLPPGNIYGLLGKNGAGKTTLLKLISGLLFPDSGECLIGGKPAARRLPEILAETLFIGEEFTLPSISTKRYLDLYAPFYPRFDRALFEKARIEFELENGAHLNKMSYGQKKKFLIAFGLATDCRLFILDEPTNGLDIPAKRQFRKLLAAHLTPERTFLISTHQVRDMQNLIDPIIILDSGRIIFQADTIETANSISIDIRRREPTDNVIYWEKVTGGYAVVTEGGADSAPEIDLELLFNAVVGNPARFAEIFPTSPAARS